MFDNLAFQLLMTVVIGAVIGLERESVKQGDTPGSAGGIRTFALVSLLGGIAGFFYNQNLQALLYFSLAFIGALVLAYYIVGTLITHRSGLTNEISIIYTFLIGFFISAQIIPIQIVLALLVILLLILSLKGKTHEWMHGISTQEVEAFISYAIISLVILPFLPNQPFYLIDIPYIPTLLSSYNVDLGQWATLEIFNPRKVWFVVVLVTGIDVFGYILSKMVGSKKGTTLSSFIAGFISSTSTTQALAQKSKKTGVVNYLVGAAILANLASFIQVFLLVGPLNSQWLVSITPTLIIIILSSFALTVFFLANKKKEKTEKNGTEKNAQKGAIFSLMPALKFAVLLIAIKLVTKVCLILFGNSGFIVSSVIASLVGIDAIVINLADMAGDVITFKMALFTLILVNATNLLSKSFYTYLQGNKKFALKFTLSMVVVIASSFLGLLFVR